MEKIMPYLFPSRPETPPKQIEALSVGVRHVRFWTILARSGRPRAVMFAIFARKLVYGSIILSYRQLTRAINRGYTFSSTPIPRAERYTLTTVNPSPPSPDRGAVSGGAARSLLDHLGARRQACPQTPNPETRNPKPKRPQPQTRNPEPETRSMKYEKRNPESEARILESKTQTPKPQTPKSQTPNFTP